MPNHNRFVIQNDLSGPVIVNIEPESIHCSLAAGEKVTVKDTFEKEPVTLKVEFDRGDTIISIWPGDGEVRVEKDGVDVFDLIQNGERLGVSHDDVQGDVQVP
jgi:hypothetical protein